MGGTSSHGGAFSAMNEEQVLTPTTPRRDITQPSDTQHQLCNADSSTTSDHIHSSVFDGKC